MPRQKPHATIRIPLRDGALLAADLWTAASTRAPAIVVLTPYDRTLWKRPLAGDYTWVVADWRGFHGSAGAKAVRQKRGQDGYDVVEWAAAQPWCDGNVGMWGPSALGRIQYLTAMERPPHLRCCVPLVASVGNRYEQYYWGGVLRQEYVDMFAKLGFNTAPAIRDHPVYDDYWRGGESLADCERIGIPMLLISGWYDVWVQGALDTYEALRAHGAAAHRLIVGPWGHYTTGREAQGERRHPNAVTVAQAEAEAFYAVHLCGEKRSMPSVRTYQIGGEQWAEGMPEGTHAILPVGPGEISHDPSNPVPTRGGSNLDPALGIGPYDQGAIRARPDVFTVEWDLPIVISGRARLEVEARSDGPFDLHARLCDGSMLVCDSVKRSEGGAVRIDFPPMRVATQRPVLILSGSNYPRYALQPRAERITIQGGRLTT